MTNDEKWRIWGAIDSYFDELLDKLDDEAFETIATVYDSMKEDIWCPNGEHDMAPDHCGLQEHYFCIFCGIQQQELDKRQK